MEFKINMRNIITFVNQWEYYPINYKIRAVRIWMIYFWKSNMCNIWIDYGIRIFGIEFCVRKWIKHY